jgi:hypothetical protein
VWLAAKHRESGSGDICVNRSGINSLRDRGLRHVRRART